jgi:hypothetical protein
MSASTVLPSMIHSLSPPPPAVSLLIPPPSLSTSPIGLQYISNVKGLLLHRCLVSLCWAVWSPDSLPPMNLPRDECCRGPQGMLYVSPAMQTPCLSRQPFIRRHIRQVMRLCFFCWCLEMSAAGASQGTLTVSSAMQAPCLSRLILRVPLLRPLTQPCPARPACTHTSPPLPTPLPGLRIPCQHLEVLCSSWLPIRASPARPLLLTCTDRSTQQPFLPPLSVNLFLQASWHPQDRPLLLLYTLIPRIFTSVQHSLPMSPVMDQPRDSLVD